MIRQLYQFLNPKFQNLFLDYRVEQKPRYGHGLPAHQLLAEIISANRNNYKATLNEVLTLKDKLWSLNTRIPLELGFSWRNNFFPGLDIIMLYTLLSNKRPEQYIEIGSGTSTIVAKQAIIDSEALTKITSIDPKPRASIESIVDHPIRTRLEQVDLSIFEGLKKGDILFVDNSHRILPNSDSMVFFLEILPRLQKGVIVHIHDIYLPYDYPQFMCDRFYSEQYGLAIALLANPQKYKIIAPNYYISEDEDLSKIVAPLWVHNNLKDTEQHGGSFWFGIA